METGPINFERKKPNRNGRFELISRFGSVYNFKNINFSLVSFFSLKPNRTKNNHPCGQLKFFLSIDFFSFAFHYLFFFLFVFLDRVIPNSQEGYQFDMLIWVRFFNFFKKLIIFLIHPSIFFLKNSLENISKWLFFLHFFLIFNICISKPLILIFLIFAYLIFFLKNTVIIQAFFLYILKKFNPVHITQKIYLVNY